MFHILHLPSVITTQVLHFNELPKDERKEPSEPSSKSKASDSSLEGQKQTTASQGQQVSVRKHSSLLTAHCASAVLGDTCLL